MVKIGQFQKTWFQTQNNLLGCVLLFKEAGVMKLCKLCNQIINLAVHNNPAKIEGRATHRRICSVMGRAVSNEGNTQSLYVSPSQRLTCIASQPNTLSKAKSLGTAAICLRQLGAMLDSLLGSRRISWALELSADMYELLLGFVSPAGFNLTPTVTCSTDNKSIMIYS